MGEGNEDTMNEMEEALARIRMGNRQDQIHRAALDRGVKCARCGDRAKQMRGDQYLCMTDVMIHDQLEWRAKQRWKDEVTRGSMSEWRWTWR